jgi:hypothetical protein
MRRSISPNSLPLLATVFNNYIARERELESTKKLIQIFVDKGYGQIWQQDENVGAGLIDLNISIRVPNVVLSLDI